MGYLDRILPVLLLCCTGVLAVLPASYDVVWDRPGINGSADSMPLGGGDIGINTWYENGKPVLNYVSSHNAFPCLNRRTHFHAKLLIYSYTVEQAPSSCTSPRAGHLTRTILC
jgi:hypothetical protein